MQEQLDQGPADDREYPNKWPKRPQMADFRHFMGAFYEQCNAICLTLVKALEASASRTGVWWSAAFQITDLRLTHYPPIPIEEMRSGRTSRIALHSDFGILTLPFQDSTGGLEVGNRSGPGTFVTVPPTDTKEMIANVGDTVQRWTNGKLFGGLHRVTIPEPMKKADGVVLPKRFTMAYLFKTQRTVSVGPLREFITADNPANMPT
ncbi:hypothetical protein DL764_007716 [Monosporascus ibericus]|uniref:Fe2OG dioxygenase domain-containing protein n=1 Tax=Monosporascus ibericus TaxID=155417 RepID=A0A4Q4T1F6_9PEZI|nr:hypothetical protein DL764_007716 [Monosporascus ibericus]